MGSHVLILKYVSSLAVGLVIGIHHFRSRGFTVILRDEKQLLATIVFVTSIGYTYWQRIFFGAITE